jgi:hypothetical protein
MDKLSVIELPAAAPDPAIAVERRRPGRAEYENPALVALLREPAAVPVEANPAADTGDDLNPARGLAIGTVMGAIMWGALGMTIWYVLGR